MVNISKARGATLKSATQDQALAAFSELLTQSEGQSGEAPAILALARMMHLAQELTQHKERKAAMIGLSAGDLDTLYTIERMDRAQRPIRVTDLVSMLDISSGGMSKRIDRLEKSAMIVREADSEDRRASRVRLTDHGRAMAVSARQHDTPQVIQALTTDQWRQLDELLHRFAVQWRLQQAQLSE